MKKHSLFLISILISYNISLSMNYEEAKQFVQMTDESKGLAVMLLDLHPEFSTLSEESQSAQINIKAQEIFQQMKEVGVDKVREQALELLEAKNEGQSSTFNPIPISPSGTIDQSESEYLNHEWDRFCLQKLNLNQEAINSIIAANKSRIVGFMRNIELGIPRAVIFNGYSGTGKSTLAQAIARSLGIDFVVIDSGSITSRYQGSSSTNVVNIFRQSQKQAGKFIIIFEEIDKLLIPTNDQSYSIAGTMQTRINECLSNYNNISIIGTSNYAHNLSPELKRRFSIIDIPFPQNENIKTMITDILKHFFPEQEFTDEQASCLRKKLGKRSLSLIEDAIKETMGFLDIQPISSETKDRKSVNNKVVHSFIKEPYYFIVNANAEEIVTEIEKNISRYYHEQLKRGKCAAQGFLKRQGDHILSSYTSSIAAGLTMSTAVGIGGFFMSRYFQSPLEGSQTSKNHTDEILILAQAKKTLEEVEEMKILLPYQIALNKQRLISEKIAAVKELFQETRNQQNHAFSLHKHHVETLQEQITGIDKTWDSAHSVQKLFSKKGFLGTIYKQFSRSYAAKEEIKKAKIGELYETQKTDFAEATSKPLTQLDSALGKLEKEAASLQDLPSQIKSTISTACDETIEKLKKYINQTTEKYDKDLKATENSPLNSAFSHVKKIRMLPGIKTVCDQAEKHPYLTVAIVTVIVASPFIYWTGKRLYQGLRNKKDEEYKLMAESE